MDNVLRPFAARLPGTVLTPTQQLVSSNLAPIFSFYTKTQLDAVVLFESSHYQPVDSQVLLQRCIDFILDNPDQLEAVVAQTAASGAYKSADVINVFSDDDDIELLGAVSNYETNLANKGRTCKTPSDKEDLTGPYTDDLPIISSPQQKRQERSSRVEIIISDSQNSNTSQNCVSVSSADDVTSPGLSSLRYNNNKQSENLNSDCELPRKADDFVDDEDSLPDLDSLFAKIDKTKTCVSDGSKSNSLPHSLFGSTSSKNDVPDGFVIKSPNKIKTDVFQTGEPSKNLPTNSVDISAKPEVKTRVPAALMADGGTSSSLGGNSPRKAGDTLTAAKIGSGPVRKLESLSSTSGAAKSPLKLFRHEVDDKNKQLRDIYANFKEECNTMIKDAFAGTFNQGTSIKAPSSVQASKQTVPSVQEPSEDDLQQCPTKCNVSNTKAGSCVDVKGLVYYSAMREISQGFLPGRLQLKSLGDQWKGSVFIEGRQEPDLMFMLEQRSIKTLIEWNEGLVLELKSGNIVKVIIDPPQAFQLKIVNKVLSGIKNGKYAAKQASSSTTTSAGPAGTVHQHVNMNRNLSNSVGANLHNVAPVQKPQPPVLYPGATIFPIHQIGQVVNNLPPPNPPVATNSTPPKPLVPYPPDLPQVIINPPTPNVPDTPDTPQVIRFPHPPQPTVIKVSHPPKPPVVNNPPPPKHPPPPPPPPVVNIPSSPTPPPEPPVVKTAEQQLEEWKLEVLQLFPRVEMGFLEGRLRAHYGKYAVNNVCSELLEMPDYPKSHTELAETVQKPQAKEESVDYYKYYDKTTLSTEDTNCSLALLKEEFRRVSARDISDVWSTYNGHYAPAYQVLEEAMRNAYATKDTSTAGTSSSRMSHHVKQITIKMKQSNKEKVIVSHLLKCGRQKRSLPYMSLLVNKEVEFVKKRKVEQKEKEDYEMAWKLNEEQYEEDGQTIECGCCYCEYPFESMVQCTEGHLFCTQCLLSYAKEAVFGSGKLNLSCMTDGCEATYPQSEMKRAVPSEILCQYEDRVREENLNLADLSDLVRCPHCNYAAIMDGEGDKVFRCQNKECMKETCRLCKEDWADHIGLPCEKVEKKDETKLRKEYEEKMTEKRVRTCHRCKSKFMKEEGCNRMTCTCRATMCYICRAPNIDYNHFCRHPRDPGKLCTDCTACSLWTNPDEDDKRAVEEIRKEAQEKRKEKGFDDDKAIGGPPEPAAKKPRRR